VEIKGAVRDQQQMKEAIDINKSLFNLRQVITALTENSKLQNKNQSRTARDKHRNEV